MSNSFVIEQARAYLEERWPFYQDMLRHMVEINSFSANPAGVNALGEMTAACFSELGFQVETIQHSQPTYGKHLFLTRPGRGENIIALVSHLDTVYPAMEEKQNDFYWREEGDRLYGPGTVDIKGGTMLIFMMMELLARLVPQIFADITWKVMLDAAEEADGEHFGALCQEQMPADKTLACLVFEGGRLHDKEAQMVVSRKGMAVYRVTTEGRAAHAGSAHHNGANAIVQMAQAINKIASFTNYQEQITFNVGTVAGGTVVNRVPHFASAFVEMRAFDPRVYQDGMAKMLSLPDMTDLQGRQGPFPCQVNVEVMRTMPSWPHNRETDRLFTLWREAGEELGLEILPEDRGGLSDGNYLWQHVPTLDGLGPAGDNAHCSERSADGGKDQEYAQRASFVPKALLNTLGIIKLVGQG